jgi:hypothetical protein
MLRMITGESDSDGLDEEPLDVLLSTIAIETLMPGLGAEEDKHCRTVNFVIVWKAETCKEEFDKMAALVKNGGEELRAQVAKVVKLLLRQHRLRVVVVSAVVSELLRKAAAKCDKERKVLDFAQALVRQRTTRFHKMVRSVADAETRSEYITDEPFEHLEGYKALDGANSEGAGSDADLVLNDAWACMQAGIVNVLCQGGKLKGLWKPVIAKFSVIDVEGKVQQGHRRVMKESDEIPAVCLLFREDLKKLARDLKVVKKLDEFPKDAELVDQLVLRLTDDWRKFVEGKRRKKGRSAEGITWRAIEKLLKKRHVKTEKPFSWTQEEQQQKQQRPPKKSTPAAGEGGAGGGGHSTAQRQQWRKDGLCDG